MKLTAEETLAAGPAPLFAALCDLDRIEQALGRNGLTIRRVTSSADGPVGTGWDVDFALRGTKRQARMTISEAAAPERMVVDGLSSGLGFRTVIAFADAPGGGALARVETELLPRTLTARLLVKSLGLAKGGVGDRFEARARAALRRLDFWARQP